MRVRRGDNRCPGDNKPGLIAVHALAQANVEHASSTRSLPNRCSVTCSQGQRTPRCSTASHPGHRSTLGCTSDDDEGATRRAALHRATRLVRKQVGASAIRTDARARTERVRECDLIKCCVASPPRCRAIGIVFRQSDVERSAKRSREERATRESPRRKGRRHPGPG